MSIDYRSLIRDRREKQSRPIVRHEVCLVPELYADLEEAQESLRQALMATVGDEDEPQDKRGGHVTAPDPDVVEAREVVKAIEAEMAAASITLVFKAPTADRQAQESDALERLKNDEPDRMNSIVVERSRTMLIECFERAEGEGRKPVDVNREDVAMLVEAWTQGEVVGLSNRILTASIGGLDLPKSAQRLLRSPHSNETSKPPSHSSTPHLES